VWVTFTATLRVGILQNADGLISNEVALSLASPGHRLLPTAMGPGYLITDCHGRALLLFARFQKTVNIRMGLIPEARVECDF